MVRLALYDPVARVALSGGSGASARHLVPLTGLKPLAAGLTHGRNEFLSFYQAGATHLAQQKVLLQVSAPGVAEAATTVSLQFLVLRVIRGPLHGSCVLSV